MKHDLYTGICWNCRNRWVSGPGTSDGHCQQYPGVPELIVSACIEYREGVPKPRKLAFCST